VSIPRIGPPQPDTKRLHDDVVEICRDLIRIDTSNYGDDSGPGERKAAEYVASILSEIGAEPEIFEAAPRRTSLVVRIPGVDRSRPALVVHGHLDVVPAQASDWSVDPFAGEVVDDCIWGRGAVDMKDMDAMILAALRDLHRAGEAPSRDLIVAFFADEEAGGDVGAGWAVRHKRDLFEGASHAISEVGGYSATIAGQKVFLLQTAEKGLAWLRLVAQGRAGHGSQLNDDNAVTKLCRAVAGIDAHPWPLDLSPTVKAFLRSVEDLTSVKLPTDDPDALVTHLGSVAKFVGSTFRTSVNATQLDAGYKANVIPGTASAVLDCRYPPGAREELWRVLRELAGADVEIETIHEAIALDVPFEGDLIDAMVAALHRAAPGVPVLPYCMSAGTDNKSFAALGITGYGFVPLDLPEDLDFAGMFHGVDERVPISSLHFGARVLRDFLTNC
jgi:acetylornithine deacetylase/succinyl-diaminopimelate desuccinylase-like protein